MFLPSLRRFRNNLILASAPGGAHRGAPEVSAGLGFFEAPKQLGKVQVSSFHVHRGVKLDGKLVSALNN